MYDDSIYSYGSKYSYDELVDLLEDLVREFGTASETGQADSMGMSSLYDAMTVLERCNKLRILHRSGRRIIGKWTNAVQS